MKPTKFIEAFNRYCGPKVIFNHITFYVDYFEIQYNHTRKIGCKYSDNMDLIATIQQIAMFAKQDAER